MSSRAADTTAAVAEASGGSDVGLDFGNCRVVTIHVDLQEVGKSFVADSGLWWSAGGGGRGDGKCRTI